VSRSADRGTPITLFLILLLLYLNTRSLTKTMIILLAVPFSASVLSVPLLLDYNLSIGSGSDSLPAGRDAETGVFMLLYLDLAYEQAKKEGASAAWRPAGSDSVRSG